MKKRELRGFLFISSQSVCDTIAMSVSFTCKYLLAIFKEDLLFNLAANTQNIFFRKFTGITENSFPIWHTNPAVFQTMAFLYVNNIKS